MVNNIRYSCDWQYTKLSEVIDKVIDNRGKTPPLSKTGYRLVEANQIKDESLYIIDNSDKQKYVDEHTFKSWFRNGHPNEGDILVTTVGNIGATAIVSSKDKICIAQNIVGLRCSNKIDPMFLLQFTKSFLFKKQINRVVMNAVQPSLKVPHLLDVEIGLPSIKEQRKIAAILSSVDEAIEKTEDIIEQTEKVKKGLMQQLLTKGIGHTKFKKTEIGEIPEKWEVLSVANVANTTSGGTPSRNKPEYFNGSIPWIKTGELKEKYIYDTEEKITEEAVKNSSAKLIPKNSIIVAMYGATIGQVSINKIDATTNQACCVIIPQKEKLNYEFLYYLLTFWKTKLIKLGAGGAQPNISQQIIKNLLIPIPSIKEQIEIANILTTLDKKVQNEKKKFDTLSKLKKSLMQSLLTGRVRVKVDEDEVMSS